MLKIVVCYTGISLILGAGTLCYLVLQYGKVYWKVASKRSRKEIAVRGDITTILVITLAITFFWLPLLAWYLLSKVRSRLSKS